LDERSANATAQLELSRWITSRALFPFLYLFSLRGNEGLFADLKGLREEYDAGWTHEPQYSTPALLGQFKGEQHHRQQLMYARDVTGSGIEVRKYISDLIVLWYAEGRMDGLAVCDPVGQQWTTAQANEILHELLCSMFDQEPSLFSSHVTSHLVIMAISTISFARFVELGAQEQSQKG
jgi:hypothetical protein